MLASTRTPLFALVTLLGFGCATTAPTPVVAADEAFAQGAAHARTVLLLPADVSIEVVEEDGPAPEPVALEASRRAAEILQAHARSALERHGYAIVGELAWDGTAVLADGRQVRALDEQGTAALFGALAQDQPPPEATLSQLRAATGADALFALSSYGRDLAGPSTGEKVAKGIFIGLFIAVVAIAIIVSHRGGGGPRVASGAARVAGSAVHVAHPVGVIAAGVRPLRVPLPAGHVHGLGCNVALGIHNGLAYGGPIAPMPNPATSPYSMSESGLGASLRLLALSDARLLWRAEALAKGSPRDPRLVWDLGDRLGATLPPAR